MWEAQGGGVVPPPGRHGLLQPADDQGGSENTTVSEFRDVVFEDVAFDNNRRYQNY